MRGDQSSVQPLDDELAKRLRFSEAVFVTRPTMPEFEDYSRLLRRIWENRWLTNKGELHQEFERRLADYLGVEHISLFCNGTVALLLTLRAFGVCGGKVVTTPFTFPATPHAISWLGAEPVFCDIDPRTLNLDAGRLAELVDSETQAILPVHVYGTPCDVEAIQAIADRHEIPVIYDAAHCFGVRHRGRALVDYGDAAILSFHATKLFSTGEGGAAVTRTAPLKQDIDDLKNFGIVDAETVATAGINGKMNEFQAAYGILQLDSIRQEIAARRELAAAYRKGLAPTPGIDVLRETPATQHNYSYFPILVQADEYGMSRDRLHETLKTLNIFTRKYFHPLCSHYPHYLNLPSADRENLPVAEAVARKILCLPIYGTLGADVAASVCEAINELHRLA